MKKKTFVVLLAICLAGTGAYFAFFNQANAKIPQQSGVTVQRMSLEDVVTSLGKLEPATYVDVGAQTSGQLMTLHVELGDTVQKGDLLAEIDPRSHKAKVEADRATIANLEATLAERRANLVQAERNYKRDKTLRKQNAASELDFQNSETSYLVAQAQVAAVEAQLQQARANLESNELNLSYTMIYAPMSGTVVSLEVKEGQTLNNNQQTPTLMRIAELEVMTVWASVSEADINKLTPGMPVYFTTIGDTETRYYSTLQKIHPSYTEENDVILYDVVFDVENPNGVFLPAMNIQVFFVRAQAENVLALPIEAVPSNNRSAGHLTLNVLLPGGKEETRNVTLGVRTRTAVEIKNGLNEGDIVKSAATGPRNAMPRNMGPRL
ncbi:efflux RND transporter periplasmic adaptor subunit [Desulfovibrio sp. OttesenSCG-928-I05]|nr:efflux RND transporter periplasmic adaptor subunit [Desulfovibrio sp. OttesenSCG-928-I05]